MGRAFSTNGGGECIQSLGGKARRKETTRKMWENITKIDPRVVG
jgi:hypothetical protein